MLPEQTFSRTCGICGNHVAPNRHRCPACNRDLPPIKAQFVALLVTVVFFCGYCALLYLSAAHGGK